MKTPAMTRWFARTLAALALSATFVTLLTWAGWPRPRFVVPLPAMAGSALVRTEADLHLQPSYGRPRGSSPAVRSPWAAFTVGERDSGFRPPTRYDSYFVNLQDGRLAGPFDGRGVQSHAWDHRGAAVVSGVRPPDFAGAGRIGRFDPEAGTYTSVAGDRLPDFLLSDNGETLLTFSARPPRPHWQPGRPLAPGRPPDGDLVCFDLTADPPTRTKLDLVLPEFNPPGPFLKDLGGFELGGVAVSPDGRTVAVSELWQVSGRRDRPGPRVGPRGVTFFDARTGQVKSRVADYGPPGTADRPDDGAFDLVFSPDSRFLRLHRQPRPDPITPVHTIYAAGQYDRGGPPSLLEVATGGYVPPPHPAYDPDRLPLPRPLRTDDGSLRTEADGDPTGADPARPFRLRVVDAAGTPRCDWRAFAAGEARGLADPPGGQFVPGTTALVWQNLVPLPPSSRWSDLLRKLLRLPVGDAAVEVVWYDWATDERRAFRRIRGIKPGYEPVTLLVQPGRVGVLHHRFLDGTGRIEVWDAPPPRRPWAWSLPVGVALGLLATAAGVRLGRRVRWRSRPAAPAAG